MVLPICTPKEELQYKNFYQSHSSVPSLLPSPFIKAPLQLYLVIYSLYPPPYHCFYAASQEPPCQGVLHVSFYSFLFLVRSSLCKWYAMEHNLSFHFPFRPMICGYPTTFQYVDPVCCFLFYQCTNYTEAQVTFKSTNLIMLLSCLITFSEFFFISLRMHSKILLTCLKGLKGSGLYLAIQNHFLSSFSLIFTFQPQVSGACYTSPFALCTRCSLFFWVSA